MIYRPCFSLASRKTNREKESCGVLPRTRLDGNQCTNERSKCPGYSSKCPGYSTDRSNEVLAPRNSVRLMSCPMAALLRLDQGARCGDRPQHVPSSLAACFVEFCEKCCFGTVTLLPRAGGPAGPFQHEEKANARQTNGENKGTTPVAATCAGSEQPLLDSHATRPPGTDPPTHPPSQTSEKNTTETPLYTSHHQLAKSLRCVFSLSNAFKTQVSTAAT